MFRPSPPRRELSPDGSDTREKKRRRKAFSCYDCRRRKLKCDRTFPACNRCINSGHAASCRYAVDGLEYADEPVPGISQPGGGDASNPGFPKPLTPASSSAPNNDVTVPGHATSRDVLDKLVRQEEKIFQLQRRVSHLERHAEDALPQCDQRPLFPAISSPHKGSSTFRASAASDNRNLDGQANAELAFMRGKNFKTQFYGASHPGCLIPQVCLYLGPVHRPGWQPSSSRTVQLTTLVY